jgi:hypothetical protein
MSKWFATNRLALNADETSTVVFATNNCPQEALNIG